MRVGIFGGSFNPIHCGHIALARHLLTAAKLDELWLMVSPQNPLKRLDSLAPDEVRLRLARKALAGDACLIASDFEFQLEKPSYTWNTLLQLSSHWPDVNFVLVIGADNWRLFDRWYRHKDILNSYEIVVYPRDGYTVDASTLPPTVHLADTPLYNVSSTEVRHRVRAGRSISGLVPEEIEQDVRDVYGQLNNNAKLN